MNEFEHKIAGAFAALPEADISLKHRLHNLPDEAAHRPRRRFAPKLLPLTAALAVLVTIGIVVTQRSTINPPEPPELPLLSWEGLLGEVGMGFEATINKNAAELQNNSPAQGREGEIGTMPVYRNPQVRSSSDFSAGRVIEQGEAAALAKTFGDALGKRYDLSQPSDEFGIWTFRCGDETLTINAWGNVGLNTPLPELSPQRITDRERYEALCQQIYERYAAGVEALTGLQFSEISTLTEYNIYGEVLFNTNFYVNNPGDSLAKQAEDYAFRQLHVSIPFASQAELDDGIEEEPSAWLQFSLHSPGEAELIGHYPVMDLQGAREALLAGRYESSVSASPEELARATIAAAELTYSGAWSHTRMPMYRLYLSFPPEDMQDWNNDNPYLEELGLRNFYVFYVPAVTAEYLTAAEGYAPAFNGG